MRVSTALTALAALLVASGARACLPPLPPAGRNFDETPEAFKARMDATLAARAKEIAAAELAQQTRAWDAAGTVMLVRQVQYATETPLAERLRPGAFFVVTTYQPVAGLKGTPLKRDIVLRYRTAFGCGATGRSAGTNGKLYVLYFRPGTPGDKTVIDWIAADRITEPRAKALLPLGE